MTSITDTVGGQFGKVRGAKPMKVSQGEMNWARKITEGGSGVQIGPASIKPKVPRYGEGFGFKKNMFAPKTRYSGI